jgi:long-chain acyl-CoA synthetase
LSETTSGPRAIAATVAALPGSAAERFADRVAVRRRVDGEWHELTYADAVEAIDEVALGLVELGIEVGDRVGILADTRWEWTLASYGISAAGGIVVPVYPTNSPRECAWVLGDSGAQAVICENADQVAKVEAVRDELEDLATIVSMEPDAGDMTLDDVRERGSGRNRGELGGRQSAVAPDDAYTIIYTSGTTGPPKGVVLTHRNAMSVCEMVEEIGIVDEGEITYLYLPLAHAFALTSQLASYDQGTTIIYYGGDTTQILQELIETQPTYMPSVPRIFEKLQEQGIDEDRERFAQAVKLGVEVRRRRERGEDVPEEMQAAFDQADERLYGRVRGLFGNHIKQAVTGAAPIAPEILEFFYACGVTVLEG